MRRPRLFIAALIVLAVFVALWAVLRFRRPVRRPTPNPTGIVNLPTVQELVNALPPESATSTAPQVPHEETTTAPAIGYLPPPAKNLTGSSLGRQRVPLPAVVDDVHQIYYHTPTLTLFMSVTEPDGRRSIWKLPEDGQAERVLSAGDQVGEISIFGDSKGVIYFQYDHPARLYRSDDGLKTWRQVLADYGSFWNIADDGRGDVYAGTHDWNRAVLYHSADDGFTWEQLADFQKLFPQYATTYAANDDRFLLRHLHGVIYDQHTQQLLVGTGDVARFAFMSPDGGKTWQKVWDEGFTSAIPMSGGFRWLLGPDQLHGHGLAIYDATVRRTVEVWNPIPFNYAGYVYSLLDVNGVYYAAVHTEANEVGAVVPKFGIIASPDGYTWYPFLEYGPLTNHARTDIWLASAPTYVYASVNGALYAFRPLDQDWFKDNIPFGR